MLLLLALGCARPLITEGPLDALTRPWVGERGRTNGSWVPLPPGGTFEILNVAGPGQVVKIWMTMAAEGDAQFTRSVRLEAYWDGATVPAVRVPVGDFFAAGHGEPAEVTSMPVLARGTGFTCFWPMPFKDGARIVLKNDGPGKVNFYYQVDWDRLPSKAVAPMRFQAGWRREALTDPASPFVIAEMQGRGNYVGTVLAVDPLGTGWWGEGDDYYYVDGDEKPTFQGTGTEDFVLQAWGLKAQSTPYAGVVDQVGRHVTLYRWFIADPIPFQSSLVVRMQQQGKPVMARSDDVAGTGFWYQMPPLSAVPELPGVPDRHSAQALKEQAWKLPSPATPVDIRGAVNGSRFATSQCLPNTQLALGRPMGAQTFSGVNFELLGGCGTDASAIVLAPTQSRTFAVSGGGEALYLLMAGFGERGKTALTVRGAGWSEALVYGADVDPWNDAWLVPEAKVAFTSEQMTTLRAAYVATVPIPAGATEVTVEAPVGSAVTVYAVSRGPAPI